MFINDDDKRKILDVSSGKLVEVIGEFTELKKHGGSWKGKCPKCGAAEGLEICEGKQVFKCFKCSGIAGKRPIDYLMKGEDFSFPEALQYLADHFHIILSDPPEKPKKESKKVRDKVSKTKEQSFCARMLQSSGLNFDDVTATVYKRDDNNTIFKSPTFFQGTINRVGEIDRSGDDAIIAYFDLDGNPVTYELKDSKGKLTGKTKEYYRVRWQFPEEHLDKNGKPFKYKSPSGSGTHIYIPERIREKYRKGEKVQILFIQEGEKKAEKASKHGLPSIAVSGIQNLGQNGRLPEDIIKFIVKCGVEKVVFILDADWNDLSSNITINEPVDKRPRQFFYAIRNYKDYFRSLSNRSLFVEIYFGYVLKNEHGDKGVDDLLANTLAGSEDKLKEDIDFCINEKNLSGSYVQLHKITSYTDYKLEEIWNLHNPLEFAQKHKEVLQDLPEFSIGRHKWRFNEKGEIESAQPIEADEQYWETIEKEDRYGNRSKTYKFRYGRCFQFLRNRGFGRYRKLDGSFEWIKVENPTVRNVQPWEIRDYLTEFTKMVAHEDVLEMIYCGGPQYLGPDKLSNLPFIEPNFETPVREKQIFYFSDKCWEITSGQIKEIDYANITHQIWNDAKKDIPAKLTTPLINVKKVDGKWNYTISDAGKACQFLQFLINTSNFTWRKERLIAEGKPDITLDPVELEENVTHLIAKLCAIGYMLVDCKDRSNSKAVVAMDGKQSEVGASNGRSGKSLIGELFKHVRSTVYINGKKKDFDSDTFLWNEVVEKTKIVFIDDLRPNFDFEFLFANITGDWAVNYKGGGRCTFPFSKSAKIYLTTNHALNGEGSSFNDRQWPIAFSDYYNDNHKPINDFGVMFFDEWDFEQWNLTWNLLATCVQLYLKFGYVESPSERIEIRKVRQLLGEEFIAWADEYFSAESKRNRRLVRKEIYDDFLNYAPDQRKWCKAPLFRKKIVKYCEYRGYVFNPQKYDRITGLPLFLDKDGKPNVDDKSGGVEYFTIGDKQFAKTPEQEINFNQPYLTGNGNDETPY